MITIINLKKKITKNYNYNNARQLSEMRLGEDIHQYLKKKKSNSKTKLNSENRTKTNKKNHQNLNKTILNICFCNQIQIYL